MPRVTMFTIINVNAIEIRIYIETWTYANPNSLLDTIAYFWYNISWPISTMVFRQSTVHGIQRITFE